MIICKVWDAQLYEGPLARAGRFLTSSDMRMQSWVVAPEDPASAARQKQQAQWQKQALVPRDSAASTSHVRHAHCMSLVQTPEDLMHVALTSHKPGHVSVMFAEGSQRAFKSCKTWSVSLACGTLTESQHCI